MTLERTLAKYWSSPDLVVLAGVADSVAQTQNVDEKNRAMAHDDACAVRADSVLDMIGSTWPVTEEEATQPVSRSVSFGAALPVHR